MEQMNDDFNRQAGNHACEPEEALSCRISADGPIVFPGSEQSVDRSALSIFAFTIFDTGRFMSAPERAHLQTVAQLLSP